MVRKFYFTRQPYVSLGSAIMPITKYQDTPSFSGTQRNYRSETAPISVPGLRLGWRYWDFSSALEAAGLSPQFVALGLTSRHLGG